MLECKVSIPLVIGNCSGTAWLDLPESGLNHICSQICSNSRRAVSSAVPQNCRIGVEVVTSPSPGTWATLGSKL